MKTSQLIYNQTYGPYTRNYAQSFWKSLSLTERSKLMARQGHSFATAEETRVVTKSPDGSLLDVPEDGKSLGEIAIRGNIVMKEARIFYVVGDLNG